MGKRNVERTVRRVKMDKVRMLERGGKGEQVEV